MTRVYGGDDDRPREPAVPSEHDAVGAYALGILDEAEATAFEAHLATCAWCARQLDELAGMEPVLAALADVPGAGPAVLAEPPPANGPRPVDALVDEVARRRAAGRRRNRLLAGVAAALIVGGPFAVATMITDDPPPRADAASQAELAFDGMGDKVTATDPTTDVTATVAMEAKAWGTHTVLKLTNVTGPRTCSLVAVGKNGQRETVTSWSVPYRGYGVPNAKTEQPKEPLYVHGGAAFTPHQIDHFEIMTSDGVRLVEVDA